MGSVMWWIGVIALALFFELCKRIGFRHACSMIWQFAGEIGPRDAAERRRRWNWRLYGERDGVPPFCGHRPVHREGHRADLALMDEVIDYPPTGQEANYADADHAPTTWPITPQSWWSDRR